MGHPKHNQGGPRPAGASLSLSLSGFVGDSIVDGPGLRCTLFCQGCPHACPGCHNPHTHPFEGGEVLSVDAVLARIAGFPLSRGVTLSGGEPFCQAEALCDVAEALRAQGYEVAAYTGYTFEDLLEQGTPAQKRLLALLDVLVDGPFLLAQRDLTLRFRGSANQRVLNVPASLSAARPVWLGQARWVGETGVP